MEININDENVLSQAKRAVVRLSPLAAAAGHDGLAVLPVAVPGSLVTWVAMVTCRRLQHTLCDVGLSLMSLEEQCTTTTGGDNGARTGRDRCLQD